MRVETEGRTPIKLWTTSPLGDVLYKDLDLVMAAQRDLVDVVHTLRAVMTVKG